MLDHTNTRKAERLSHWCTFSILEIGNGDASNDHMKLYIRKCIKDIRIAFF